MSELSTKRQEALKVALGKLRIESFRDRQVFSKSENELVLQSQSIQIERCLAEFLVKSSRQEFSSANHFVSLLYRTWYSLLEDVSGLYERPTDELGCDDRCALEHHCILPLCDSMKIYGCTRHGTTHHCGRGKCKLTLTTHQWTKVCIFSGEEVGRELALVTSVSEEMRPENSGGRSAFNMFVAHQQAASVIGEFQSTEAVSENDQRILRERIDRGEPLNIKASTYDNNRCVRRVSQAEWRSFRFECEISQVAEEAEKRLHVVAGSVVDDILFTAETREMLNIQLLKEARSKARLALKEYYGTCKSKGIFPCNLTAATYFHTPMKLFSALPFVEQDPHRRSRLVNHCVRLWQVCHRSPFMKKVLSHTAQKNDRQQSSCSFVQFCVTVLFLHVDGMYIQRGGFGSGFSCITNRFAFVPQDIRMRIELPPEERIDVFGPDSTRTMYEHISAADVPEKIGVGSTSFRNQQKRSDSISGNLYNEKNQLTVRKKSRARRSTAVNSGQKLITVQASVNGDRIAASERDVLPSYLHSSLVGKPGAYEKSFMQIGRNFIRACLNSFDEDELSRESKWLFAS
jgi:hypothetical protein